MRKLVCWQMEVMENLKDASKYSKHAKAMKMKPRICCHNSYSKNIKRNCEVIVNHILIALKSMASYCYTSLVISECSLISVSDV